MTINDLHISYDGVCIYATTVVKARTIGKLLLFLSNLSLAIIIAFFLIEQIIAAAIVFLLGEIFMIRYTLWNLYGEERLIINTKSISFQYHYGFFTTVLQTVAFNKRISICSLDEMTEGDQTYVKCLFQSYNENYLSENIYASVLHINKADYEKLIRKFEL